MILRRAPQNRHAPHHAPRGSTSAARSSPNFPAQQRDPHKCIDLGGGRGWVPTAGLAEPMSTVAHAKFCEKLPLLRTFPISDPQCLARTGSCV